MKNPLILLSFSIAFFLMSSQSANSSQHIIMEVVLENDSIIHEVMVPVELNNVTVGGEIGRRIDITTYNNLLKLDIERDFLAPCRERNQPGGYVGLGKLIDASVKLAYYSKNPKVLELKQDLINVVTKTQEEDGYIGMLKEDARMWKLWDIHEMGYIVFGLVSDYRYFKNQQSLQSAVRLANHIIQNWSMEMPEVWMKSQISSHLAMIGLDRAFIALYSQTSDPQYLNFLITKLNVKDWDMDIVMGRQEKVEGHIYAYLTRCLAQLELNRLNPDEKLLHSATKALTFLAEKEGTLITGETGQWECWTNDQDGEHALGETCATAYQIRFYENLFRLKGNCWYGDMIERTIYNALFAAQSPDGRKIRYYTPLEGQREYFDKDTYCCPNNYRRIIAELPAMICYQSDNGVAINLYTPSTVKINLSEANTVLIQQVTDYPNSGVVKVVVSPSHTASFPVSLRIPSWAKEATLTVNNEKMLSAKSGSMFKVERKWSVNDTITLNMPMKWQFVKGRQRQAGRTAIMRGPVVYCLNPELNKGNGIEKMSNHELGRIRIDPNSINGPFPDERIRAHGTNCTIGAWKEGYGIDGKHDFELTLSEFIDPQGTVSYFSTRNFEYGEDDELYLKSKICEKKFY